MLDELRDRMVAYLARNQVCVIACMNTGRQDGAWAIPARYYRDGLELACFIPRWADIVYYVQQDPQVLLIIQDPTSPGKSWLEYRGIAKLLPCKNLAQTGLISESELDTRFVVLHVQPERIDLLDESHGWGARETLEV